MLLFFQVIGVLSCDLLSLPTSLNYFSPSYSLTHKLEVSGQFFAPDSPLQWDFEVFEESWFRLTLEPKYFSIHTTFTITQKPISKTILSSNFGQISSKLPIGFYTLKIDPDALEELNEDNIGCSKPSVHMSLALSPLSAVLQSRHTNENDLGFPDIHGFTDSPLYSGFGHQSSFITLKTNFTDVIHSYNFSLDAPTSEQRNSGITGMWKVTFMINHDFLTFGGLRVVLALQDKEIDFDSDTPCIGCVFGKRERKNALALNALLSPGKYKITIFYSGSKFDKELFRLVNELISLSFIAGLIPLAEKADRLNCKAGVLPRELDSGFKHDGFLRFSDYLAADFSANVQQSKFSIKQESVLRIVTVQSQSFNVKVQLKDISHRLVKESVFGHETNSLVDVLDPGTYFLILSEAGSVAEEINNKFCETFQISIGISPRNSLREVVKSFQECDDEKTLEALMSSVQSSLDENGRFEVLPERSFSLENPEFKIVFHTQLELKEMVFVYFEIFSDFVANDLFLMIVNKDEEVFHNDEHRYLQGALKPGKYQFMIKLRSEVAGLKSTDCINFNLNIKIVKTSKKALESWKCTNQNTYTLPSTLNTLDKLGPKNTDQKFIPTTILFNKKILAPKSEKDLYDSTKFFVQTESQIKALTEASQGTMKLVLLASGQQIASDSANTQLFPPIYSLSSSLSSGTEYELRVYYYPKDTKTCHTYTLALEIYPSGSEQECIGDEPDESLLIRRTVDTENFEFVNAEGFSPADPYFVYQRGKKAYVKSIPFEISDEFALVSGHLISNHFGLTVEVYKEGILAEWGTYETSHRYQLTPIKLYKGSYVVLLKDLFTSSVPECMRVSISLLIESVAYSQNTANLMRKTETCLFLEPPHNFEYTGLSETGSGHLYQKIDSNFFVVDLGFDIKEKSLIRVFISPRKMGVIEIDVKEKKTHNSLISAKVKSLTDGLAVYLEKGEYYLMVRNDRSSSWHGECEFLEIDVEVMTETQVKELIGAFDCKSSTGLPELEELNEVNTLFDSTKNSSLPILLTEPSEVTIFLSYLSSISGHISLVLSNNHTEKISESLGGENFAQIKANLDPGTYKLDLITSNSALSNPCWPVRISMQVQNTAETCVAGPVPSRLISKYGGPQGVDGSVTFVGTFRVSSNPDLIFVENPKNSFLRITGIASSSQVFIEFIVFKDKKLKEKVAYSQGSLSKVSLVSSLDARKSGYYILISYITQSQEKCLTFDLKIQIEAYSTVVKMTECQAYNSNLLPKEAFTFSDSTGYTKDNSAVLSSWIQGIAPMPPSSQSSELIFSYTISLKILNKGIFSAQVLHDFLTTFYTLKLYSEDKVIATSTWELIFSKQTHDRFNFASILPNLVLDPGDYKLVLKTGTSNKLLLSLFPDTSLCFPFSFNLEFTSYDPDMNQLVLVTPDELKDHNPLDAVALRLTFKDPVESVSLYLLSGNKEKMLPDKVRTVAGANQLIFEFWPARLKPNECYNLIVDEKKLKRYERKHEYCVVGCKCNENSLATCSEILECICPIPYTGIGCYECVDGFRSEAGVCVEEGIGEYFVFWVVYMMVGFGLVWVVRKLRKRESRERGVELAERQMTGREINLYED